MRIVLALIVVLIATCGLAVWWWQSDSSLERLGADVGQTPVVAEDPSPRVFEATEPTAVDDPAIASKSDVEQVQGEPGDSGDRTTPTESEHDAARETDQPDGKHVGPSPEKTSSEETIFQAALSEEPIPFEDLCFRTANLVPPTREQLLQWFKSVPRHQGSMQETRTRGGKCMALEGVHRLLAPWAQQRVLRLYVNPQQRLHLYFYHGDTGLALHWDLRQAEMAAYVVSRHENEVFPYRYQLAATDLGRIPRVLPRPPVPLDLRFQDQELIVSCGDIAILRAPMPEIPEDVFWDGRAEVHGLMLSPSFPFPDSSEEKSISVDVQRPAELGWSGELSDAAEWKPSDEGAVVLTARDAERPGWIIAPLPRRGLQLVDVRISNVTPGTAVFLGWKGRPPGLAVRFLQDRRSKRTCAALSLNANESSKTWNEPTSSLVPFVGETVWIRFAYGAGVYRWWLSCDGRNWAESDVLASGMQEPVTHIGLQYAAGKELRRIQLDQLLLREFTTFPRLIPAELRGMDLTPPVAANLEQWRLQVMSLTPEGVDEELWRRVMAVRSLEDGCDLKLGTELLALLLDDSSVTQLTVTERMEFVGDAALLVGQPNLGRDSPTIWDRYFEIGRDAWWQHGESPFSSIRRGVMEVMLVRYHQPSWDFENSIRLELLSLLGDSQWQKLRETTRVLDFYRLAENEPLVAWARRRANEELGGESASEPRGRHAFRWQPPYAEELSREAYNAVVELKTLIASRSFEDAAKSIGNARLDRIAGVTPSLSDGSLRYSPRVAVQASIAEAPELVEQLEEEYGQLARLRIRQGIESGDVSSVRQAVEQFVGTRAAADGQAWLGDQALARGDGGVALTLYRKALRSTNDQRQSHIRARMVLAAAMRGIRIAQDVLGPVAIGEHQLTSEQFSVLVDDVLASHSDDANATVSAAIRQLASRELLERKPLNWRMGEQPERAMLPGIDQFGVNWAGRQTHALVRADTLLISNRFELRALDPATFVTRWSSPLVAEQLMQGQDWGLIAMRPLVRGARVICRQLYQPQPAMVCCDLETGKLLWANQGEDHVFASDPFILRDRLACLTVTRSQQFESSLQLVFLDEATGHVEDTFEILRLRESWWVRRCCEVTLSEDGLIVVLGGVTAAVDGEGHVRWIRESEALPLEADQYSIRQHFCPATLAGSRLLVAQPGVPSIECVDPSSGVLLWRRVLPDIEAVLGVNQEAVIVRLRRHIASLDIKNGGSFWLRRLDDQLLASHYSGHDRLIVSRAVQPDANRKELCPQLLLLETHTGNTIQELTLEPLLGVQPHLGPLVAVGDRLISFWGNGHRSPTRELILLGPP